MVAIADGEVDIVSRGLARRTKRQLQDGSGELGEERTEALYVKSVIDWLIQLPLP